MGRETVRRSAALVLPGQPHAVRAGAAAVFSATIVLVLTALTFLLVPKGVLGPIGRVEAGTAAAVAIGVGVLALDAVAPVPSSAIMIAMGAALGVGVATLAGFLGLSAAAFVGYALGRFGATAAARLTATSVEGSDFGGNGLGGRGGVLAVVLSRPVPLLAETTAVAAGVTAMPLRAFVPSVAVGAIAPAVVYAVIGAGLSSLPRAPLVATATVVVALVALLAHRLTAARLPTGPRS